MRSRGLILALLFASTPSLAADPELSQAARTELSMALLPKEAREITSDSEVARVGFEEVISRALAYHSAALLARSETRRLIAVLWQARAASLPTL